MKLGPDHGYTFEGLSENIALALRNAGGPDDPIDKNLSVLTATQVYIIRAERHRSFKEDLKEK